MDRETYDVVYSKFSLEVTPLYYNHEIRQHELVSNYVTTCRHGNYIGSLSLFTVAAMCQCMSRGKNNRVVSSLSYQILFRWGFKPTSVSNVISLR